MFSWLLIVACGTSGNGGGNKDGNTEDTGTGSDDPFVQLTDDIRSNRNGVLTVEIEVEEGDEVFQVVAVSDSRFQVSTEYLTDPDGRVVLDWEDWYYNENSLTSSIYPTEFAGTFNWPVREEDGPLTPGVWTWSGATTAPSGEYEANVDIQSIVMKRPDPSFAEGKMNAIIAYSGGLESDKEVVRGMEAGAAYWQEIYASHGIDLTVTFTTIDVDADLPATYAGDAEYEAIMQELGERGFLMVVGDLIQSHEGLFGEAGGIPGPYWPQPHGAVEVSWIAHAGGNGRFSDDEIAILGETMAHEVGHYLGLFHPVEYTWNWWDALGDTDECDNWTDCEADLGENLMFPYPVADGRGYLRQNDLTEEQSGVAHRYVGVE